jgi:hypothetical protein
VIHIDAGAPETVRRTIEKAAAQLDGIFLVRQHYCRWGTFSLVAATIECIATLVALKKPFDYAVLLSGQDYPIKSNSSIRQFFKDNDGRQFIESFSLQKPNRWSGNSGPYNSQARIRYFHFNFRRYWIYFKSRREFPLGWEPYGGSQWWMLSRDCIVYLHSFIRDNPSFVRYFRNVFIPDESFFQSVISNSPFRTVVANDDARFIDWKNPNPKVTDDDRPSIRNRISKIYGLMNRLLFRLLRHRAMMISQFLLPRTFVTSDFETLSESPKLFARKFDPVQSEECLRLIDRNLLGIV